MIAQTAKAKQPVILIDDNEIDNFINENILKASGVCREVISFTSGNSALEVLSNFYRSGFLTDHKEVIIFLDLNMPLMNGFEFLDHFEKLPGKFADHFKVVILTSSHDPSDLQKSRNYERVCKYLAKPLSEDAIMELFA